MQIFSKTSVVCIALFLEHVVNDSAAIGTRIGQLSRENTFTKMAKLNVFIFNSVSFSNLANLSIEIVFQARLFYLSTCSYLIGIRDWKILIKFKSTSYFCCCSLTVL